MTRRLDPKKLLSLLLVGALLLAPLPAWGASYLP